MENTRHPLGLLSKKERQEKILSKRHLRKIFPQTTQKTAVFFVFKSGSSRNHGKLCVEACFSMSSLIESTRVNGTSVHPQAFHVANTKTIAFTLNSTIVLEGLQGSQKFKTISEICEICEQNNP
ncbi:MAG: hypothetical protein WCT05_11825 [Lentisphaeria bacterium]